MRIFIGYDPRQPVAATVLMHSIARRASKPISITPLILSTLPIKRRGLTDFTYSRFLCPWLCRFRGRSLFLDADMLVLGDITELFARGFGAHAVSVVKHKEEFERASLMLFDNRLCKMLTPEFIENPGSNLFDFEWAQNVGDLPAEWNHLVGYNEPRRDVKLVHFTKGIPCHRETQGVEYAEEWRAEAASAGSSVSWQEMMGSSVHVNRMAAPNVIKFATMIAIDGDERAERMRENMRRTIPRLEPQPERPGVLAVCGYGPSLRKTWNKIQTPHICVTSGAHDFLIERGLKPSWHVVFDPREEQIRFVEKPLAECTYCLSSQCHPRLFDHLAKNDVRLWHALGSDREADKALVAEAEDDGILLLGGSTVGIRAIAVGHVLGFREFALFGLDCSYEGDDTWAGPHPGKPHASFKVECNGKEFLTSDIMINAAEEQFRFTLGDLGDCKMTVYGDSLFAERVKLLHFDRHRAINDWWTPVGWEPELRGSPIDGVAQVDDLISENAISLNARLHADSAEYGSYGSRHAARVRSLMGVLDTMDVLDYGCGKASLSQVLGGAIRNYDPAVAAFAAPPSPADIVVCTDVLEHVEPCSIDAVIGHLARVTKKIAYIEVATRTAAKTFADGRNTHLIVCPPIWWEKKLKKHFEPIETRSEDGISLTMLCRPRR